MGRAAFITYPLSVIVNADWVHSAQDIIAFRACPDDGFKAITAKVILLVIYRMLPGIYVFSFLTYITYIHKSPFSKQE